ncbi:18S rRNA (guanine-N(7))-methyltransferase RID2 [Tanacetum coccineum]
MGIPVPDGDGIEIFIPAGLDVALERETDGDLILGDRGQGLGIRHGAIDGAISISAVQWLCNADKSCHGPRLRLKYVSLLLSLFQCSHNDHIPVRNLNFLLLKSKKSDSAQTDTRVEKDDFKNLVTHWFCEDAQKSLVTEVPFSISLLDTRDQDIDATVNAYSEAKHTFEASPILLYAGIPTYSYSYYHVYTKSDPYHARVLVLMGQFSTGQFREDEDHRRMSYVTCKFEDIHFL